LIPNIILAAAVSWASVGNTLEYPEEPRALGQAEELVKAIKVFQILHGRYPTESEGLDILTKHLNKKKPIIEEVPKDPWGRAYRYSRGDTKQFVSLTVRSSGPDKKFNASDDVLVLTKVPLK